MKNNHVWANKLSDIAGKSRLVPDGHGMLEVARRMGISRASVSIAMKQLRQNGYITVDKGHRLCLTDAGRAVAVRIYERHCFFTEMLLRAGVSFATAQRDACRMEHAISEESFARLKEFIDAGRPKKY